MPIRSAVKSYLVEQLTDVIPDVTVSRSWPGANVQRDHVWIDRATGTVSYPLMMAGRKTRQDEFTIWLVFQASGPGDSGADVDDRVESYMEDFDSWIADDPSLGGLDGVIHALLGESDGPHTVPDPEGHGSFMVVELNVLARLD